MGDVHPLYDLFWFLTSFFKIRKIFFASVIQIISSVFGYNILFFKWVEGGFSGIPKEGGVIPPHKSWDVFLDMASTASRLNTLCGLETWYAQLSKHVKIIQIVTRHIQHFWLISDVINVGFLRHFAVFDYSKCLIVSRNSWFSYRICVLIGSTSLPSLICKRYCII